MEMHKCAGQDQDNINLEQLLLKEKEKTKKHLDKKIGL
jgi:hypothetical protein